MAIWTLKYSHPLPSLSFVIITKMSFLASDYWFFYCLLSGSAWFWSFGSFTSYTLFSLIPFLSPEADSPFKPSEFIWYPQVTCSLSAPRLSYSGWLILPFLTSSVPLPIWTLSYFPFPSDHVLFMHSFSATVCLVCAAAFCKAGGLQRRHGPVVTQAIRIQCT